MQAFENGLLVGIDIYQKTDFCYNTYGPGKVV